MAVSGYGRGGLAVDQEKRRFNHESWTQGEHASWAPWGTDRKRDVKRVDLLQRKVSARKGE